MAKPYKELRKQMCGEEIDQQAMAAHLGKSQHYVSTRMRGLYPWDMEDVYKLCDLLGLPVEQIAVYFPRKESVRGAS